ncbi:PKD domain-containing protein [Taibaiella soli]|uniref:PKD domain-containing protein n=1 Tax=Taibaiella soli TaxID=1649169 RepID=A0A2W2B206_9BACT|nr:PKD domain-containing protein [Taibaiella soli]PZF74058.1 hypothetical protein DN068_05030 [Taibaiella soli]
MNYQFPKQLSAALLLFFIFCNLSETHAQSWLWGKRGGGATNSYGSAEEVSGIATDKAGNVYVLGDAYDPLVNVDNHQMNVWGWQGFNQLLTSWDCNGHYRWTKMLGATNGSIVGMSLKTDTLGGVYVVGYMTAFQQYGPAHFDSDTTIASTFRTVFLMKYDTAGVYQWLRLPQSDTVGIYSYNNTRICDVDLDAGGNTYMLAILAQGSYVNGSLIVPQKAMYMVQYDASGNFVSATPFPIDYRNSALFLFNMKRNHKNGDFYLSGMFQLATNDTLFIGATTVTKSTYLARLSAQGIVYWVKQSDVGEPGIYGPIDVDDAGNVYISGYGYPGDVFNGFSITPSGISGIPIAMAIDSNGNNIWGRFAESNGGNSGYGMTFNRATNEVFMWGSYAGSISWAGYNKMLNHAFNSETDIYVVRFNAQTGAVNGMDTTASDWGSIEFPHKATIDKRGNFYIGGEFRSMMYIGPDTISNYGGFTDWFVAKFGFNNCDCTVPVASFGYSLAGKTAQFSYGGSAQVDSVRWTFGDSTTSTQQNPSHTYASYGTYTTCLTVYNNCGHTDSCRVIQIASSVNNINPLANVLVYPNPVQNHLMIETPTSYHAAILSIDGRVLVQQDINAPRTMINTSSLVSGIYLLQLTDNNGQRALMKVAKE